jgi:hypothetical protein
MKLFALFREYKIEDYYEAQSLVGIFSSKALAEAGIYQLEEQYKQALVKRYEEHCKFMTPEKVVERWEKERLSWADEFARKQEGSNRWKLVKENLEYYQGLIDKKEFPKIESFDEWKKSSYFYRGFDRGKYSIEEMTLDELS